MAERIYSVPDVNCEHCVDAITRELQQIDGVKRIDVDLDSKRVTVESDDSVTDEQVRAGIDEAGFDVAP